MRILIVIVICNRVGLGYKKASNAIAQHVDKEDVLKWNTPTTSGIQQMLYVNESGLYALILGAELSQILSNWKKRG